MTTLPKIGDRVVLRKGRLYFECWDHGCHWTSQEDVPGTVELLDEYRNVYMRPDKGGHVYSAPCGSFEPVAESWTVEEILAREG